MKARPSFFLLALFVGALSLQAALAGEPVGALSSADERIPAVIAVPEGQAGALRLTAKGVQIYECRAVPGQPGKYEWAFKAPEADLFDGEGHKVGRHYAGPTWELSDGGKVVGKLRAKADAPDSGGIPWLLLDAAESTGPGVLGRTRSIQRLHTVGGRPPAELADASNAGQTRQVEYTAAYVFNVAKP